MTPETGFNEGTRNLDPVVTASRVSLVNGSSSIGDVIKELSTSTVTSKSDELDRWVDPKGARGIMESFCDLPKVSEAVECGGILDD